MSNEQHIRQRLDEFISAFGASPTRGRPNARFGHVKIPGFRLQELSLMESIRQSLSSTTVENVIFAASEMERAIGLGFPEGDFADDDILPTELAFSELLTFVKMNRAEEGHGLTWKSPRDGTWEPDRIFPRNIAVVFQIDPSVPADCALALIAIVQWALDVSSETGSYIRVLSLATDDDCQFLKELTSGVPEVSVDYLDLSVQDVSFITESAMAQMHSTQDDTTTIKALAEDFRRDPTVPQLVLSFRAADLAGSYKKKIGQVHDSFVEHSYEHQGLLNYATYQNDLHAVWLTVSPALCLLPIQFEGYGKVHILLSSQRVSVAWDNVTEQLAENLRWTSREEREAQLQWARQMPNSEVHIHLEDENTGSMEEIIEQFTRSNNCRRRQVENSQMGGFIAAVMSLASWGLDVDRMISCFIRYPSRVGCMQDRLTIQRIITSTSLDLSQGEAIAFTTILPLVSYDYRLAFFVALKSDQMVRKVKIQLAAIISSDVRNLVTMRTDHLIDPFGEEAQNILDSCWGHCNGMEEYGTFWLLLGLWKGFEVAKNNGRDNVAPWRGLVEVNDDVSFRAKNLLQAMSMALLKVGVASASHQTFDDETSPFVEERKRILQTHLLQAYIFQLTSGYNVFAELETGPHALRFHRIIANDVRVEVPRNFRSVTSILSIDRLLEDAGDNLVLGIFQEVLRFVQSANCLMDWTMVPKDLVAKWLVDHRPGLAMRLALGSRVQQCPINVDEIDGRKD
ncbi:hypothetical protein FPCIR_12918 [Fusarium pseudocircinatum]|uniref:Uncharacterized protein n=1 Tax=Fusarium pseudocircinatum TaxID=56676 RepID=A0A8H5KMD1_9HYPO|nr:hypothetical protein FPCIR_12918 [Fusarium pseudocircinatum]